MSSCPEPFGLQLYPDPATCNRFFKCANGTLTHEACENGLLFDRNKAFSGAVNNHCAYNWDSNCDERPADNTPISSPGCPYQVMHSATGWSICGTKEQILIFDFFSNFDDFLQPKSLIL